MKRIKFSIKVVISFNSSRSEKEIHTVRKYEKG